MAKKYGTNQLSFSFFDEAGDVSVLEEVGQPPLPLTLVAEVVKNSVECFEITNQLDSIASSQELKVKANLEVIRLLKSDKQNYTPAQKATLARYTGWGGAAGVFDAAQKALGSKYHDELKSLLTEKEFSDARASVLNAYYTEPFVIKAMWEMLRKMGFEGGNVIDPSSGIGHFLGCMPNDMRSQSSMTMVEPDSVSVKVLQKLYGDESKVWIHGYGLEKTRFKPGSFDLAISNIPFGDYKLHDPRFNDMKLKIHDYFFAKGLDLVRDGGLVAFITSTGTLDKSVTGLREYLAEKADLVAAVRLPSGTFQRLGNTTVATDIVILRKKSASAKDFKGCAFTRTSYERYLSLKKPGVNYYPNEYFVENQNMHIGVGENTSRYGGTGVEIVFQGDLQQTLESLIETTEFPIAYSPAERKVHSEAQMMDVNYSVVSGYYLNKKDEVVYIAPDSSVESQAHLNGKAYGRLKGMVAIRDTALELMEAEIKDSDSSGLRDKLNVKYDLFVKEYGPLMSPTNRRLISLDSNAPLLWSMEFYDEEKEEVKKADIFSRSTISKAVLADKAESYGDALALSYNRFGRLDFEYMVKALDSTPEQVKEGLLSAELVFENPVTGQLEDAQAYLAGNVRQKHMEAKDAFERSGQYGLNVLRLQAVVPPTVPIQEIAIKLGAPWIEAELVEQFVREEIFECELDPESTYSTQPCTVKHNPSLASWNVNASYMFEKTPLATAEWGTSRKNVFELLQIGLNQQQPTVIDTEKTAEGVRSVTNGPETTAAREKLERLSDAFSKWAKADEDRAAKLETIFNDMYNSKVNRVYDGSHLVIPGLNPNIKLRSAQKDAIWRGIVSGNTMLQIAVGGGKTLMEIITAQESKRLGLATKPVLIVPNHMLEAFAGEYMRAFPRAKILAASKADMETDRRKTLLMRIATGNWDAVIITHSSFGKISVSKKRAQQYANEQICELEAALSRSSATDNTQVREFERAKKTLAAKLEKLTDRAEIENWGVPFEKLGIDLLIVDEADLFKNLWFSTKKTRVAGLSNTASHRAFDLFLKSRIVFERTGSNSRGLIFATATPISNTIAEMFIMQTYLQIDALREAGIANFDAWAANFATEVTAIEVAPDGSGYRMHTRFAKFVNVPELLRLYKEVAEIKTKKMLNLPVPKLVGGKHTIVAAKPSHGLLEFVQTLVARSQAIKNKQVKPNEDNMLCVTNDGRKAALDMRNINEAYGDFTGSKINLAVENILKHWKEGASGKLTQLVFSDLSTPKAYKFSVYTDIKAKLIAAGVPECEIGFAQDYDTDVKKAQFHRKIRQGMIRIAFGSTEFMGFGTNVQDRLIAEHHLDAPWRPRDVEQRDGRIERQGNTNPEVWIYRYVTEMSFDAYSWQTLERKSAFNDQLWEGTGGRTMEDISTAALSCAEVKALASGNPLVIEKAGVDSEVAKLWSLRQSFQDGVRIMQRDLSNNEFIVKTNKSNIQKIEVDIVLLTGKMPELEINGKKMPVNLDSAEAFYKKQLICMGTLKLPGNTERSVRLGRFAGMELVVKREYYGEITYLVSESGMQYQLRAPYGKEKIAAWFENTVLDIPSEILKETKASLERAEKQVTSLERQLERPFEYQSRLDDALVRQRHIDSQLGVDESETSADELESQEA